MSADALYVRTILEAASLQHGFPEPLHLTAEAIEACSVDTNASQVFHALAGQRDIDIGKALSPVLEPVTTQREYDRWFNPRSLLIVDIVLVTDMPENKASHDTIWFLLNLTDGTGDATEGFAIPAAQRVYGSSRWLASLCMPLDPAVYTANIALSYGTALKPRLDQERARLLEEYFMRYPSS